MGSDHKLIWSFLIISFLSLKLIDGDGIRLPDQKEEQSSSPLQLSSIQQKQEQPPAVFPEGRHINGRNLLDFIGLGTGPNKDPYVIKTNQNCLTGDLSECFKTQALNTFEEFFVRDSYNLNKNVRVVRMPEEHQRSILNSNSYEFSSEPRSSDSEWDQLIKYALRRVERFIKSTALEINVPEEFTDDGRYSPRFVDGITDEIDIIEDKKAPLFTRHKLKKLFIPLLLVLKIFKLKLLLFLPFILGLISIKKFLGLAAIILPGIFAYFKFCRPQQNFGQNVFASDGFPQYTPQGVGAASLNAYHHYNGQYSNRNPFHHPEPHFVKPSYVDYYGKSSDTITSNNGIRFSDNNNNNNNQNHGQNYGSDLAYQGYSEYRSNTKKDAK